MFINGEFKKRWAYQVINLFYYRKLELKPIPGVEPDL